MIIIWGLHEILINNVKNVIKETVQLTDKSGGNPVYV